MRTIGVRELKATLSQRLQEVRAGEVYWVTDRGAVIAELRAPGPSAPAAADEFERRIADRVRSGRAVCGGRNRAELYERSPLRCAEGTAERVLDALRREE
jgi:antitoxin (DNA-binding transcriptional repressor) of toxin-antitoxin stability system